MPPQRKKAKTTYVEPVTNEVPITDPALHPDLAAQSTPVKMDPGVLHPDLAAASTPLAPSAQSPTFSVDTVAVTTPTPALPKQRKNAAAGSKAAAAAAAALQAQQAAHQQQLAEQALAQQQQNPGQEQEPPAVSIDAAAEFLRTIQERESQKHMLALQTSQPDPLIGADGGIPTDLSALYPVHQPQASYQGFPTATQFNEMVHEYLSSLSPKKQAKALLTQQMYDDILTVLLHPTETKVGSAQFRFWSKKMFKLVSTQVAHIVIHENKPVAVKEQLYDVLVQCHGQANHGGRDKTAAQVILAPPLFRFYLLTWGFRFANFIRGCQRSLSLGLSRVVRVVSAIPTLRRLLFGNRFWTCVTYYYCSFILRLRRWRAPTEGCLCSACFIAIFDKSPRCFVSGPEEYRSGYDCRTRIRNIGRRS